MLFFGHPTRTCLLGATLLLALGSYSPVSLARGHHRSGSNTMTIGGKTINVGGVYDPYQYFPRASVPVAPVGRASQLSASSSPDHLPSSPSLRPGNYYALSSQPCWDAAAAYHHVDPWLLYSIAYVESRFNRNAVNRNTNGSVDLGMMQINSIWYPALRTQGIPMSALNNACASIYIGAWILSKNIHKYGYTWQAIGAYNSATPGKSYRYAQKVYAAWRLLTRTHDLSALRNSYLASE